jgi:response regulator RpfG family c-di-GMP phosphodiesterase
VKKKSTTLFLVDDDADDLDFFQEAIKQIDPYIRLISTSDSCLLLQELKRGQLPVPDLFFLDLNMPRVDGKMLLREIKSIPLYTSVPVIIYSTSIHPRDVHDACSLGAVYFFSKPSSFSELVTRLNEILSCDWNEVGLNTPHRR